MSVLRIALLGAESSGKSTLASALACHYHTVWVPEYLREFVETEGRVPREEDQYPIACKQMAREEAAAARANGLLFCDTTPMMTAIYSQFYWGRVDAGLTQLDARHNYAHTLVTAPDSPWEEDGLMRESEEVRQHIHQQVLAMLAARGIAYTLVNGALAQRVKQVECLLGRTGEAIRIVAASGN
jgi:NadR type nicotinamide-nucleotide adenylyltransferase